jgi:anti-sigma regulatory factor (Ser/Thr protein kinase)
MYFPPELESCARARLFVRSTLRRWGRDGDRVDDAALVASELATNAVVHARSGFSVEVHVEGEALRVTVGDTAPAPAAAWRVQPRHGLSIVGALCNRWRVSPMERGKAVSAELAVGDD